ncbi:hypothetical protein [Laspinema olomoucense]|nr:hypothetical protein [Laspinema sp. D3d]
MVSRIYCRWKDAMGPSSTGVERNLPMTLNLKSDRIFRQEQ